MSPLGLSPAGMSSLHPSRASKQALGLIAGAVVSLSAGRAAAQVNVESFRRQVPEQGLGASVDVRFTGQMGNNEGVTLGGSGLVGGRHGKNFGFFAANGDYSQLNKATQIARYFGHVRYNRTLLPWLIAEAYAQIQANRFQRLVMRRLLGTGPRFDFIDNDEMTLFYGASYMVQFETIDRRQPDSGLLIEHRMSNNAGVRYQLDDRVTVSTTIYYQPRFDDFTDYRILDQSDLGFAIDGHVTATISAYLRYDTRPPLTVKRLDFRLLNSLGLRF